MSGDAPTTPAPHGLGDNKAIKFTVKTGGKTWECTLQDRAQHERNRAALSRSGSSESITTDSSADSQKST